MNALENIDEPFQRGHSAATPKKCVEHCDLRLTCRRITWDQAGGVGLKATRRGLLTDLQCHCHDRRNGQAWWRGVAQPRRLKSPLSDGRHRSGINVLAHAAQEASFLYSAATIDENLHDLYAAQTGDIESGEIRRDVHDLRRHVSVAADTASGRGVNVAIGRGSRGERRRTCGDRRVCWCLGPLAASASHCHREPQGAPDILMHGTLGHQMPVVGRTSRARGTSANR